MFDPLLPVVPPSQQLDVYFLPSVFTKCASHEYAKKGREIETITMNKIRYIWGIGFCTSQSHRSFDSRSITVSHLCTLSTGSLNHFSLFLNLTANRR